MSSLMNILALSTTLCRGFVFYLRMGAKYPAFSGLLKLNTKSYARL